jgi:hypothetical protein
VSIKYGAPLADGQLTGTATATVNNQTVMVTGTYTYTDPTADGTILNASGTAYSYAVTFTPDDTTDYTAASGMVTINVAKANQTIMVTTPAPGGATYGTSFNVAATTSSGLAVTIAASGAGTVSSGGIGSATVMMISGTGTAAVTVSQAGNSNYNAATIVTESVNAQKASQTINVTQAPPADTVSGSSFGVAATASSGLGVAIAATGAGSGGGTGLATITINSASGAVTITFSQAGNANYASATTSDTVQVIGPGASAVGTELWYVGRNTTGGSANNSVQISPSGTSNTGSSGVVVNGTTFNQSFTAIRFFGYNGNDTIQINPSLTIPTFITDGNGNDSVSAGNNANAITLGNGNDGIQLGSGNNTVILGDGRDNVRLGDGNNVVETGNGNDNIQAGNGDNLIVAGTGPHSVQAGNGHNILIDGSVQLAGGASLSQVLNLWVLYGNSPSNVAVIRSDLTVTYNTTYPNNLKAGSAFDWFWYTNTKDSTNRKAIDLLN